MTASSRRRPAAAGRTRAAPATSAAGGSGFLAATLVINYALLTVLGQGRRDRPYLPA
jgi:hypothetical protein